MISDGISHSIETEIQAKNIMWWFYKRLSEFADDSIYYQEIDRDTFYGEDKLFLSEFQSGPTVIPHHEHIGSHLAYLFLHYVFNGIHEFTKTFCDFAWLIIMWWKYDMGFVTWDPLIFIFTLMSISLSQDVMTLTNLMSCQSRVWLLRWTRRDALYTLRCENP